MSSILCACCNILYTRCTPWQYTEECYRWKTITSRDSRNPTSFKNSVKSLSQNLKMPEKVFLSRFVMSSNKDLTIVMLQTGILTHRERYQKKSSASGLRVLVTFLTSFVCLGFRGQRSGETLTFAALPAGQYAAPLEEHTNCIR